MAGRDSLTLNAGLDLHTDTDLPFHLDAGSELARRKTASVYGGLALKWAF